MDRARTVRRITAVFLGAQAVYLVGLAVVLSLFGTSVRELDADPGAGGAVAAGALVLLAGVALGVAAVQALRSSAGPDAAPTPTWVLPLAGAVNLGVLVVGAVAAFWPLVAVAVAATVLVGVQIAWDRPASAVAGHRDAPSR